MAKNITGERIKMLRDKRKITAEQLGQAIGKDRATIYRYESGRIGKIPYGVIVKLSNALNTSVDYLSGKTENDKRNWLDFLENSGLYTALHEPAIRAMATDPRLNSDDLYQLSEKEIELISSIVKEAGTLNDNEIDSLIKLHSIYVEQHKHTEEDINE